MFLQFIAIYLHRIVPSSTHGLDQEAVESTRPTKLDTKTKHFTQIVFTVFYMMQN